MICEFKGNNNVHTKIPSQRRETSGDRWTGRQMLQSFFSFIRLHVRTVLFILLDSAFRPYYVATYDAIFPYSFSVSKFLTWLTYCTIRMVKRSWLVKSQNAFFWSIWIDGAVSQSWNILSIFASHLLTLQTWDLITFADVYSIAWDEVVNIYYYVRPISLYASVLQAPVTNKYYKRWIAPLFRIT